MTATKVMVDEDVMNVKPNFGEIQNWSAIVSTATVITVKQGVT